MRVEPGQRARDEGLVEGARIVQRVERLRRLDGDVVVGIDHAPAEGPQQAVQPAVAVADRIAERAAHGPALGGERPGGVEKAVGVRR